MKTYNIRGKKINAEGQEEFWNDVQDGIWEPGSFDVLDRYLGPCKRFADIGAWNGVLSLYASALGAKCMVLEPDEVAVELLEANWLANENADWEINTVAIGDKKGFSKLYNKPEGFGNSISTILPARGAGEVPAEIFMHTLETFFSGFIGSYALIKMDIEGGELIAIEQSIAYLTKHKPTMYVSFHPNWFPNKNRDVQLLAMTLFREIGYKCETPEGKEIDAIDFQYRLTATNDLHSYIFKSC